MDDRMKSNCVEPAPPMPHIADMIGELEAQQDAIAGIIAGLEWRVDRRYKTMEQAAQRADLLREAYDVRIVKSNTGVGDADSCACE